MGKVHPELDELSALADGELAPAQASLIRTHLGRCSACSARLASFVGLDLTLSATPSVTCAGSLELRSALLDGQLTDPEAAVAREHIGVCATCAADEVAWLASDQAIRILPPGLPTAATDAAIRRLTEKGGPARPGLRGIAPAGLRVGMAAALVLAIVVGLVPTGTPAEQQAQLPGDSVVLVSAAQQIVHYKPSNTFYVLQPAVAAVDAVDAATNVHRKRIAVGGKPIEIALDVVQSRILVLDQSNKSLIEIDPASNTVVRSTAIDIPGTPTSLRVASDGKVVVAAARDPGARSPGGPRPTPDAKAGDVAVLDSARKLETIRTVEVAPRQVVTDPEGKGALYVSESGTTVVDSSYQPQRTLPGGVGAAYGSAGWIAVLGASGADAVLHLFGDGAPQPLRLTGEPLAITSMPEGGFAVLLGSGSGNGRIVVIDEAGAPVGTTPVDQVGRDLAYDADAQRFAVVSGGNVISAALPAGIVARQPELVAAPGPSEPPQSPAASAPPVSAEPLASPSASPSAGPSAAVALPSPTTPPVVPLSAQKVTDTLYRIPLGGKLPILTAASATRIWFLDQQNRLNAVEMLTGDVLQVASLPRDAQITSLTATQSYAFALDALAGTMYIVDAITDRVGTETLMPFRGSPAITTDGGSRVWVASSKTPELFALDALTRRLEVYYVGMQASLLAFDATRGVWFSDGGRAIGFYDFATGLATQLSLETAGSARSLLPDPSGTLWVATTGGEVIAVRDGKPQSPARVTDRITSLGLDPGGALWYSAGFGGTAAYGAVGGPARRLPGLATSLTFDLLSRAWLADPLGGFYLVVEGSR